MNIPSFTNSKVVDENGYFTPEWSILMSQLLTQLQLNAGQEGLIPPKLTTTQISYLTDADKSNGAIVQDSTTGDFMGNINGTWKTFTLV